MKQCRIGLNTMLPQNYVFYDPLAPVYLTLTNPVGYIHRVTSSIIRGLNGGTLIDIDNCIDIQNKCFKTPLRTGVANNSVNNTTEANTKNNTTEANTKNNTTEANTKNNNVSEEDVKEDTKATKNKQK